MELPVNLSLMPVVTVIAAGNRVMLKPSKFAPATNAVLASMTVADIVFGKLLSNRDSNVVRCDRSATNHAGQITPQIDAHGR